MVQKACWVNVLGERQGVMGNRKEAKEGDAGHDDDGLLIMNMAMIPVMMVALIMIMIIMAMMKDVATATIMCMMMLMLTMKVMTVVW